MRTAWGASLGEKGPGPPHSPPACHSVSKLLHQLGKKAACCPQAGPWGQGPCGALTGQVLQQLDVILWNQPPLAVQSPL